jgi:uncharacterized membrane protein YeaQ/YmgE (transglycosylase-associated protein family)
MGVGWIAGIIIGGIAGGLAEQLMKSNMGLLMNIVLGMVGAAIADAISSMFGDLSWGMVGLPNRRVHRRVLTDLIARLVMGSRTAGGVLCGITTGVRS